MDNTVRAGAEGHVEQVQPAAKVAAVRHVVVVVETGAVAVGKGMRENGVYTSLKVTESGFETCFGWDRWDPAPKVLGSDAKTRLKSSCCLLLHFDV